MHTRSDINEVADLLRQMRPDHVSQKALAIRAGTSQSYVSRVESGEVVPSVRQLEHLLRCLGYELRLGVQPLPRRSDPDGLPTQLAMSAEERVQSAAELHNAMLELKGNLDG
jgi:transcriptional regulator with XRE-family HTH domain